MTEREYFISWLNDAYSTELAMIPVLENHAEDARDYPEIYERDVQHLEETKWQAERVKMMIEGLGGKVSIMKKITGKTLGLGKSVSTGIFPDELIKNFLADYAAEHLEIASYKSLIATAKHLGEDECVPVLEEILAEEEAMAAWLKEHIPMATVESLKISASDANSGRFRKSEGAKGFAARLFKPSALLTVLGIGAVGAGVAMLLRQSSQNGNGGELAAANAQSLENGGGLSGSSGDGIRQTDIIITETLIIEEEPELVIARVSGGDNI